MPYNDTTVCGLRIRFKHLNAYELPITVHYTDLRLGCYCFTSKDRLFMLNTHTKLAL